MGIHWCNDHPRYVNYPSDLQMSTVCGAACSCSGFAAHMCRLMNSFSVCLDAVTRTPESLNRARTLKCYLLGLPTLQIKPFPSPQIKAKNLHAEAGSKPAAAQKSAHGAIHSA